VISDDGVAVKTTRTARPLLGVRPLLIALAAHLLACAGQIAAPDFRVSPGCGPAFPYQAGWLGGDAAYSVPLPDGESLWLFGDSFVAANEQPDRLGAAFIHNSIAVSRCDPNGQWQIDYAWGHGSDGKPRAFLEREQSNGWWWLFDGFMHDERLYLGLLEVEKIPPQGTLQMPFAFTGVQLGRIANPRDPPQDWQVEVIALASQPSLPRLLPASSLVVSGEYLYLFSFIDHSDGRHPRGLARVPLRALDGRSFDLSEDIEMLATDGSWRVGLDARDVRVLMDDTATEMSVRFHAGLGRWLAIYNYPDVGDRFPEESPSDAVWIRSAPKIAGPWSERQLLYRIPELAASDARSRDPNTGCYAAKEHPQYATERRITFTYVCNLFTGPDQDPMAVLRRLQRDMRLYRPIPVTLELRLHD
jgi:hypothetical protein